MKLIPTILISICFRCVVCNSTAETSSESGTSTSYLSSSMSPTTSVNTSAINTTTITPTTTTVGATDNETTENTEDNFTTTEESTQHSTDITGNSESTTTTNENIASTKPVTNTARITGTSESTTATKTSTTTVPSKGEGLALAEKQKRNGLTSAVIIAGSLILIGIAYLSSFVDKPSEKVPTVPFTELNKERYKYAPSKRNVKTNNEGKATEIDKQTRFSETSQFSQQKPGPSTETKVETTVTVAEIQNENTRKRQNKEGKSGWDVLTKNPKFFDDYQPQHTTTSGD